MPPRAVKRKKLSEPESPANDAAATTYGDKHAAFTAWSKERGVEIRNAKPAQLPGRGLGLVTTAKIKPGARILFVPEKAMFKPDKSVPNASPQAQLAISAMKACKATDSGMSTWAATWPTDSDFEHSMPMRWPAYLRDLLPPAVEQPLRRQEEDYAKDVEAVRDLLAAGGYSEDDFRYYWSIVNSRSFHWKPPKGKAGSMVMCPFIDYINHAPSGTTCDVFQRANGYEVVADRNYEILATYGAHSNDKLLVHYGFVCASDPKTPNHDDDIRLDHILLPALTPAVRTQLQDVGFLGGYALLPATNELCFKTQVTVRAMLLTCNEWEYYVANGEDLGEDHSGAVKKFVEPLLRRYWDEASASFDCVAQRRKQMPAEAGELALLETRWSQIAHALQKLLT
ncbi:hypothetical protein B0A55_05689 [Friedmanniomyces simplex]|uniref:SET domain-containing protein n=1 Tax=Friedmanniomyces simplex TaxID=329884 RepID=A0A4U0XFX3_9PEZI|nr:hypothetical protein B0A55_05689 [Friedmanniomyces simplex]